MIIFLTIIIGCLVGILLGINAPTISYTYSGYLAIRDYCSIRFSIWWNNLSFKGKF